MSSIRVEIVGRDKVLAMFNRLRPLAGQRVREVVNRTALAIQSAAKRLCPVDTGRLRSSIRVDFHLGGLAGWIGTDVEYAFAVEYGTGVYGPQKRPIVIRPKTARMLSWVNAAGQRVFARQVVQQGQRPRPFLGPAYDEHAQAFERDLAAALSSAVESA